MRRFSALLAGICLLLFTGTAFAHEFVIVPQPWKNYKKGQKIPLVITTTHTFANSDELDRAEDMAATYAGETISLTANQNWLTYDGQITLKEKGAAIISGTRAAQIWTDTDTGEEFGPKSKYKNAIRAVQYEKYAKLLLPVDGDTTGFNKSVGSALEIVPVDNPLTAKVGDEIRVKVLLDGKPVMFDSIQATYNGFSDIPGAWAWAATPTAHGEGTVRITAPGLWSIRVMVEVDEKNSKDFDARSYKAILTFPVQ